MNRYLLIKTPVRAGMTIVPSAANHLLLVMALLAASSVAAAKDCRVVHYTPNTIIQVNSALKQQTRIQLPADVLDKPHAGNKDLWMTDAAANQVLIMPNSDQPEGESTNVEVFTKDGGAFDIQAMRSDIKNQDVCVVVQTDGPAFSASDRAGLAAAQTTRAMGGPGEQALYSQLQEARAESDDDKKQAAVEALRRYRYHIYTRYEWSKGSGFGGKNVISDVYDDGRFTYIRLENPDRGLLSVETIVGGKPAVVPTTYDDSYGMYTIVGIYPSFTLRQDKTKITITRADNESRGDN